MKFKFGSFEAEVDALDLGFEERFEAYYQTLTETVKQISPNGMRSEYIKKYCVAVFTFFNDLFGAGTDKKLFGEEINMRVCDAALKELALCISQSITEYSKESAESNSNIQNAFGIKQNRAQRRTKK